MRKKLFCVVIPAYNEEKVIESSLKALKKVVSKKDIYVVSDGSTDNTVPLSYGASVNVLALQENFGKARALLHLIRSYDLCLGYQYLLFSDADSRLSKDFIKKILPLVKSKPACIVGNVTSDRRGLISAFRTYEYSLSHLVYKNAQNVMKTITVAPGCASLYRSDVIKKLNFKNQTLTEDFDLTLQIYEKKLGTVLYAPKAKVITQDPLTIKDYWNQVSRWYTGFWQNFFLHKLFVPNRKINFEIYLMLLDFVAGIGTIIYLALHPTFLIKFIISAFSMIIILATIILSSQKRFKEIIYTPTFPLIYLLNLIAYIYSFFRAIFSKKRLAWKKVARYEAKKI
jgi:cellulose synthase/poly-beta-1,6-N-acetylglucosamine synthase-like glycosyltransferase